MNKYRIEYLCNDDFYGEVEVYAADEISAMMLFEDFGYSDVISVECYQIEDDD